ncbi:MAG: DUF502 domain-containing protein [Bacteroidetes bacterium]|nr:DUF502 domain-containing protein [Bacteroidota bacterium]MBS1632026.1 DUF502 domain-containing protein [Bacteroidota bacterium]
MSAQKKNKPRSFFRKIFRYFLQGVIVLAPIGVTAWAIYWLFDRVDSILRPYLNIPGLGFVIILVFIILVGWISTQFFVGSIINLFDTWMDRTPVIKFIYTSTKDFFEAFGGEKKKFSHPILATIFSDDVWVMGFLTDEELEKLDMGAEMVSIYIPQAYHWAGQLYILPRHKLKRIEKLTPGEAMKYAITGGVVDLEEDKKDIQKPAPVVINKNPELIG